MNPWRKLILFAAIVLLPAVIVGISNFSAFPDSSLAATLMLVVTVSVAGLFTWQSGNATAKISRYCIIADIIICVILAINLSGHWLLAREVSAARQATVERHTEEDRELQRHKAEAEIEIARKKADAQQSHADAERARANAGLIEAERRRQLALPRWQRRDSSPVTAPTVQPTEESVIAPISTPTPEIEPEKTPKLTVEQVKNRWWWFLTALAIAECAASIVAGAVLAGVWEWDRNKDGIPDHLQNQNLFPRSIDAGKQ